VLRLLSIFRLRWAKDFPVDVGESFCAFCGCLCAACVFAVWGGRIGVVVFAMLGGEDYLGEF